MLHSQVVRSKYLVYLFLQQVLLCFRILDQRIERIEVRGGSQPVVDVIKHANIHFRYKNDEYDASGSKLSPDSHAVISTLQAVARQQLQG